MLACFWVLYSASLIYVSDFVPVPYYFDNCSFEVYVEIRKHDISSFVLILKTILAFLFFVCLFVYFHTNFGVIYSSSVKNAIGILIGFVLEL